MKDKTKNRLLKVLEYSLPSLFVLILLMIVLAIKGIYPFGAGSPSFIDYDCALVPSYSYLWDLLHGNSNIFVDWNLGAGSNMFASSILNTFISPLSWLIALFPRTKIIYCIIYIIAIKMMLMAFTFYYMSKKLFKNVDKWVLTIFAILWVFSGWFCIHYGNIGWLDVMILFPILVLSIKYLLNNGKVWPYVLLLTTCLLFSYYISYMILVGVVICAIVYLCIFRKDNKKVAANLFWGTIISIALSAILFLPSCFTSLGAHRFTNAANTSRAFEMFGSKLVILLFYSLPIYLFIKLMTKYNKDKKNILSFILCFSIICAGLFIEPINAMWHTGSYFCFPFRYSFILILIMMLAGLYYLDKFYTEDRENYLQKLENRPQKKVDFVTGIVILSILSVLFIVFAVVLSAAGTHQHPFRKIGVVVTLLYVVVVALGIIVVWLITKYKKKAVVYSLIGALCLLQVLCFGIKFIGVSTKTSVLSVVSIQQIDTTAMDKSYRLKSQDYIYFENYPLLTAYPSMSTWIHISSEEQYQAHTNLGYSSESTSLCGFGGTSFSDMLMRNRYVMSVDSLNNNLYTQIDSWDYYNKDGAVTVYLYEYKYYLDNFVSYIWEDIKDFRGENLIETQNNIYKGLFNKSTDIMNILTASKTADEDENGYTTYSLMVNGLQSVYLSPNSSDISTIILGEREIEAFNGFMDLGTYQDEMLTFKIKGGDQSKVAYGGILVNDIQALSEEISNEVSNFELVGNKIKFTINNVSGATNVFVPYTWLDNMTASLNGKTVELQQVLYNYISVPLEEGENEIVITFIPQYFKIGIIVSVCALLLFILFFILNKKLKITEKKWVQIAGFSGACVIGAVIVFLVYLKPLVMGLISLF